MRVGRGFFLEHGLKDVGAIGDDAINAERDELAHGCGPIGGPGNDAEACVAQLGDIDQWIRAEQCRVERGEGRCSRAVDLSVSTGGGEESKVGIDLHGS